MKKILLPAALMLSSCLLVGTAHAYTATNVLNVQANIMPSCSVTTVSVNFGNISEGSVTPVTTTGSVDVTCGGSTAYTIALDGGSHYNGTRRMSDGGTQFLTYDLLEPANTSSWGDSGTIGATNIWSPVTGTGTISYVVNATLTPVVVTPAAFTDTVNVTVYY
jgi:spore coat protein U-like protein